MIPVDTLDGVKFLSFNQTFGLAESMAPNFDKPSFDGNLLFARNFPQGENVWSPFCHFQLSQNIFNRIISKI